MQEPVQNEGVESGAEVAEVAEVAEETKAKETKSVKVEIKPAPYNIKKDLDFGAMKNCVVLCEYVDGTLGVIGANVPKDVLDEFAKRM